MKKGKSIIIALLLVILTAGGAFAYVYMATDILKTDQELFFKYLSQITAEENGFLDRNIEELQKKKAQTPYENSGNLTIDAKIPEEIEEIDVSHVNDLSFEFSGKTDIVNRMVERDFILDYGNNAIFPITYRQVEDIYGLKIQPVSSKFIALKNENLKEFAQKLGAEDVSDIPNKIEFSEIESEFKFTEEEKEQLKEIYSTVLETQLSKENFSSEKLADGTNYILQLNGEQVKTLLVKMLEATKQNTLLIDKVKDYIVQVLENDEQMPAETVESMIEEINGMDYLENIDEIISDINDIDGSEFLNLKVTLTQKDKMLSKITCEYGNNKLSIEKVNDTDKLSYGINLEIIEIPSSEDNSDSEEDMQIKLCANMQLTGLQQLTNVQETYQIGFGVVAEGTSLEYEYNINNNVQFKDSVSVDEFDKGTTLFVNDHDVEFLTGFFTQLGERIVQVNKEQMQKLGLEEDENPLIYSNPIMALRLVIYNMASETIDEVDFSGQEVAAFNDQFSHFEGEMRGTQVNAMMNTVLNSNLRSKADGFPYDENSVDNEKYVKITGSFVIDPNATSLGDKADTSKIYTVEVKHSDKTGYVNEIVVTE